MLRRLAGSVAAIVLLTAVHAGAATPPPTPVPPRGSPSPFPTSLHTQPPSPNRPPTIGAASAVLVDLSSGQTLYSLRPDAERPVASLTKIMTALVVLERTSPHRILTVPASAVAPPRAVGVSNLGLRAGERISVENLLYGLLLASASDAALTLATDLAGSVASFVDAMNRRAAQLGATHTRFLSPDGLDDRGYSTASDIATITRAAFREPLFRTITATKFRVIPGPPGGKPRHIQNRNVLLWLYPGAIGGKTGFTSAAGFCVVGIAQRDGRRLAAVVLGERGEPFSDAAELLTWGFDEFAAATPVHSGQVLGSRQIGGSTVEVSAARDLSLLVPRSAVSQLEIHTRVGVTSRDVGVGDTVGTVVVTGPNGRLGAVPLIVSNVLQPAAAVGGSWWVRATSAVVSGLVSALHGIFGG